MKNPLALFTAAALAALAALIGINLTNWPGGSLDGQKSAEAAIEPQSAPSQEVNKTPEQKPAEATEVAEKPVEMAAIPASPPPKAGVQAKPELDTVRVESDGQAIVAGRAEPGAEVSLKLGDQVIGKGLANPDGSWVVVPDQPLPKGAHEITIEQKTANTPPVTADQSIAVAVPEKAGQQAMVALTEPGTATKVLQAGGYQEQASLPETPAEPQAEQPKAPEAAAEKPAEPEQPKTPETAAKPAEPVSESTVAKTEVPDAVAPPSETQQKTAPSKAAEDVALGLAAVDYDDKGDIVFSGKAKPGSAVRLYVDNRAVGDAAVGEAGTWSFAGKDIIVPGTHNLRVDQIDKGGKVIARVELPFLRENAEAVAELNTAPKPEETEGQQAAQDDEAQASQPAAEQSARKTPEVAQTTIQPAQTATAPTQKTAEAAQTTTPSPTMAKPAQTTTAPAQKTAEPARTTPAQTAAGKAPEAGTSQPAKTAEAEVKKIGPQASMTAPQQPAAGAKTEESAVVAATEAAKAVDPNSPRTGKIVIQPGNNLWKLSRVIYGRGKQYTVIYQANREQIRSPSRIYPGQIFAIPNANPPQSIDPKRKDPLTSDEGGAAQ
jgi:nucleoid-associated protein YgaU